MCGSQVCTMKVYVPNMYRLKSYINLQSNETNLSSKHLCLDYRIIIVLNSTWNS